MAASATGSGDRIISVTVSMAVLGGRCYIREMMQ